MLTVTVSARSKDLSLDKAWKLLTDIEKYPQRIKYVKKVVVHDTGVGSQWDDITTILWIPLKMPHTVISSKKNREYSFEVPLLFGGIMKQKYCLSSESATSTLIYCSITYDLGLKILNRTIGLILKRRLKSMLESSLEKFGGEII
jgi:hypothetical protein